MQAASSPPSALTRQSVRLRSACDSCSAAKVKCNKSRPACERCSSNDLPCVYSISRRHGCKRKVAGESFPPAHRVSSGRGDHALSTSVHQGFSYTNTDQVLDPFPSLADDDFAVNMDVNGTKFSGFAFGNSPPTPHESSRNACFSPDEPEPAPTPWMPFTLPSAALLNGDNLDVPAYRQAPSTSSSGVGNTPNEIPDSYKNPALANGKETLTEVHDCEAYALTLLRSLHHKPLSSSDKYRQITFSNHAGAIPETYPASSSTDPEAALTLDTILSTNRCVLAGVVKLLDCSCAQHSRLATLYLSIITKMLSLYEKAVTTEALSSDSAPSTNRTEDMAAGLPLPRSSIIQVGVFDLDEEDQVTLQRGILLRQLRKMEGAIEKFAFLDETYAKSQDISVCQWHSVAVIMIRKELHRIYQKCKERLLMSA